MENNYHGGERREFARLPYSKPLAYKVCKEETLLKILKGYTVNVSQAGLLCNIQDKVNLNDILWLAFDKSVLIICSEMERKSFIYQNGIIGKVVRIDLNKNLTYDIGVKFITRVENCTKEIEAKFVSLKNEET
ncbi:MAG: PilZ domain-containing protein [Candidatus Omnitrophota bacterium]